MTQWGLDTLFNPGKRHMDDEKRRLQSTREEVGDASGGRRIDLESGSVSISLPGAKPRGNPAADDANPAAAGPEDGSDAGAAVLPPALDAEQEPALALASDTGIEPPLDTLDAGGDAIDVDEPDPVLVPDATADATTDPTTDVVESVAPVEAVATSEPEPAREPEAVAEPAPEPGAVAEPAAEPAPEPEAAAAPASRRRLSASAWSRRG